MTDGPRRSIVDTEVEVALGDKANFLAKLRAQREAHADLLAGEVR